MKKRKTLIVIFILLVFVGIYTKREQNLGELLDISKKDVWKCSIEEIYCAEKQWNDRITEVDQKEFDRILSMLDGINISLKAWEWNSELNAGEYCYDLRIFDGSRHWIRFMEDGEIHILNGGHWVFVANAEDTKECINILEELLQEY